MAAYLSVISLLWADSKILLLKRQQSRFFALKFKLENSCQGKTKTKAKTAPNGLHELFG